MRAPRGRSPNVSLGARLRQRKTRFYSVTPVAFNASMSSCFIAVLESRNSCQSKYLPLTLGLLGQPHTSGEILERVVLNSVSEGERWTTFGSEHRDRLCEPGRWDKARLQACPRQVLGKRPVLGDQESTEAFVFETSRKGGQTVVSFPDLDKARTGSEFGVGHGLKGQVSLEVGPDNHAVVDFAPNRLSAEEEGFQRCEYVDLFDKIATSLPVIVGPPSEEIEKSRGIEDDSRRGVRHRTSVEWRQDSRLQELSQRENRLASAHFHP